MKIFGLGSELHGRVCTGFTVVKVDGKKQYLVNFSGGETLSLQEVEEIVLDSNE